MQILHAFYRSSITGATLPRTLQIDSCATACHRLPVPTISDLRSQLQLSLGVFYTIERELGGAGMSRVFVALERPYGRLVVVKVLPPELLGTVSVERFRREILLAARLQHPHIVPMLSAGEIDGLPYYIMPFVEGQSLRQRIEHGDLSAENAVNILRDVAKALAYAHGKGVTHRDIKPDNVLLAGTSAMITDFGVAKALREAMVGGPLTSVGISLGTPVYMAPEQAAADPSTDSRADIYAFGVMAYEMLAGHPPFSGRNAQELIAAHFVETPVSIDVIRPAISPTLSHLVMRCLEKHPGDRPQDANEILRSLTSVSALPNGAAAQASVAPTAVVDAHARRVRVRLAVLAAFLILAGTAGTLFWRIAKPGDDGFIDLRSLAVLPFENTSGDTSYNYLEDGMTDHIRDALNSVPQLVVKARSSSQRMKGRDASDVGAALGVRAVLQGTVSRSRARLHVTAELVRASDNVAMWSRTFDALPGDLTAIQDTIARALRSRLGRPGVALATSEPRSASARGTDNIEAYDRFLQATYAYDHLQFARAAALLGEAVAIDPRFARAHGLLAMSYASLPVTTGAPPDAANARARASAATAISLDSAVAEAYTAEGFALFSEMRLSEGLKAMAKALSFAPNDAGRLADYALALSQLGRLPEALTYARRARENDPLSPNAAGILSYVLRMAGQYDDAAAMCRTGLALDPRNVLLHEGLGYALLFALRQDSAVASFEKAVHLDSTMIASRANLVLGYAAAGRWKDAGRLRRTLENGTGHLSEYERTIIQIAYGEFDAATVSLDRAVANREGIISIKSIACDPMFNPLKGSARFAQLLRRLGATPCSSSERWPVRGH